MTGEKTYYETDYQVSQTECDMYDNGKFSFLLRRMQDAATDHLNFRSVKTSELREAKLAFAIIRMALEIRKPLRYADRIALVTWAQEPKGPYWRRNFEVRRGGELIAQAASNWVLINTETRAPLRPSAFPFNFDFAGGHEPGVRIEKARYEPTGPVREGRRTIVYSDIDVNGHCNNAVYADLFSDLCPELFEGGRVVRRYDVTYSHEAVMGDVIALETSCAGGKGWIRGRREADGKRCFEAMMETAAC